LNLQFLRKAEDTNVANVMLKATGASCLVLRMQKVRSHFHNVKCAFDAIEVLRE